jgi:hypothetical protein
MGRSRLQTKKTTKSYVRINLTLRAEDAEYLRDLAYVLFVAQNPDTAKASLRRGERPSASMAVRFLIDERRRADGGKKPGVHITKSDGSDVTVVYDKQGTRVQTVREHEGIKTEHRRTLDAAGKSAHESMAITVQAEPATATAPGPATQGGKRR